MHAHYVILHHEQSDGSFVLSECGSRAFAFLTSWVVHFWFKWTGKLVRKNVHHMQNMCRGCVLLEKLASPHFLISKRGKFQFVWSVLQFFVSKTSFTVFVQPRRVHSQSDYKIREICSLLEYLRFYAPKGYNRGIHLLSEYMQSELKVCDKGTFYRKYKRNVSSCLPHREVISQSQPVPDSLNQISTPHSHPPFDIAVRYRNVRGLTTIRQQFNQTFVCKYSQCIRYVPIIYSPSFLRAPLPRLTARLTLTPIPLQRVAHFSQDLRLINLNGNESHSHFRFRAKAIPSKWISHSPRPLPPKDGVQTKPRLLPPCYM